MSDLNLLHDLRTIAPSIGKITVTSDLKVERSRNTLFNRGLGHARDFFSKPFTASSDREAAQTTLQNFQVMLAQHYSDEIAATAVAPLRERNIRHLSGQDALEALNHAERSRLHQTHRNRVRAARVKQELYTLKDPGTLPGPLQPHATLVVPPDFEPETPREPPVHSPHPSPEPVHGDRTPPPASVDSPSPPTQAQEEPQRAAQPSSLPELLETALEKQKISLDQFTPDALDFIFQDFQYTVEEASAHGRVNLDEQQLVNMATDTLQFYLKLPEADRDQLLSLRARAQAAAQTFFREQLADNPMSFADLADLARYSRLFREFVDDFGHDISQESDFAHWHLIAGSYESLTPEQRSQLLQNYLSRSSPLWVARLTFKDAVEHWRNGPHQEEYDNPSEVPHFHHEENLPVRIELAHDVMKLAEALPLVLAQLNGYPLEDIEAEMRLSIDFAEKVKRDAIRKSTAQTMESHLGIWRRNTSFLRLSGKLADDLLDLQDQIVTGTPVLTQEQMDKRLTQALTEMAQVEKEYRVLSGYSDKVATETQALTSNHTMFRTIGELLGDEEVIRAMSLMESPALSLLLDNTKFHRLPPVNTSSPQPQERSGTASAAPPRSPVDSVEATPAQHSQAQRPPFVMTGEAFTRTTQSQIQQNVVSFKDGVMEPIVMSRPSEAQGDKDYPVSKLYTISNPELTRTIGGVEDRPDRPSEVAEPVRKGQYSSPDQRERQLSNFCEGDAQLTQLVSRLAQGSAMAHYLQVFKPFARFKTPLGEEVTANLATGSTDSRVEVARGDETYGQGPSDPNLYITYKANYAINSYTLAGEQAGTQVTIDPGTTLPDDNQVVVRGVIRVNPDTLAIDILPPDFTFNITLQGPQVVQPTAEQ